MVLICYSPFSVFKKVMSKGPVLIWYFQVVHPDHLRSLNMIKVLRFMWGFKSSRKEGWTCITIVKILLLLDSMVITLMVKHVSSSSDCYRLQNR